MTQTQLMKSRSKRNSNKVKEVRELKAERVKERSRSPVANRSDSYKV
jgi:hypothetical protein